MTLQLTAPLYAVSEEWEHNGYDDSDWCRVMFNPNTGTLERHLTHSTRFASGWSVTVTGVYAKLNGLHGYVAHEYKRDFDGKGEYLATSRIMVEVPVSRYVMPKNTPERVWQAAESAYAELVFASLKAENTRNARRPGKGKLCKVVSGRKIAKGETVTVLGNPVPDTYQGHNNGEKVLVQTTSKGALKTNLKNLEVIAPEKYETPEAELREKARAIAATRNFYGYFRTSGVSML
jgi:hypothetical protein